MRSGANSGWTDKDEGEGPNGFAAFDGGKRAWRRGAPGRNERRAGSAVRLHAFNRDLPRSAGRGPPQHALFLDERQCHPRGDRRRSGGDQQGGARRRSGLRRQQRHSQGAGGLSEPRMAQPDDAHDGEGGPARPQRWHAERARLVVERRPVDRAGAGDAADRLDGDDDRRRAQRHRQAAAAAHQARLLSRRRDPRLSRVDR